jgi:hypothetical protein
LGARPRTALEFDAAYYLASYPDIAAAGIDPLQHFLAVGDKEGRNPNRFFSTKGYLEANPDIAATHSHPFLHFVLCGYAEGRGGWQRPDAAR